MPHFIFDVDGTLTPSRMPIDPDFANWLEHFATHHACYIVTGSDREKTLEQVGSTIYNLCVRVYNCSGNDVYEQNHNVYKGELLIPQDVLDHLDAFLQKSKFPHKTGKHFDYRPGLMNFSVLGRNNTLEQRAEYIKWDKETGERKLCAENMRSLFPDLLFEVAGDTGIDITAPGCDKAQILRDFDVVNDHIYFFGDKMEYGGNDYSLSFALATKGHKVHQVKKWEDTWEHLKKLSV